MPRQRSGCALKKIGINDQKFKQESERLITKLQSSK